MSKIICEVCGSSYSETATQCPICGTAKSEEIKPVEETTVEEQTPKGGKFSKSNVRRNTPRAPRDKENEAPSNVAMIAIVAVLLLAIVAVCVFIAIRVIGNKPEPSNPGSTPVPSTSSTAPNTQTQPPVVDVPCTGIELVGNAEKTLSFTDLGQTAQLTVKALPEDTTDHVVCSFTTSDAAVALVDQSGLVTCVAEGTATITVTYETFSIEVVVTCDIPEKFTELKLNRTDFTLNGLDDKWNLTSGSSYVGPDPSEIVWTSSNENVVVVENGIVTPVGNGSAKITATYGELTATCDVYCKNMVSRDYILWTGYTNGNTVYAVEGESFVLKLVEKDNHDNVILLAANQWNTSNEFKNFCTMEFVEGGVKVTANKATKTAEGENVAIGGYVYIEVEYEGTLYRCTIVIRPAEQTEE